MKTPIKFVLLVFAAASISAAMALPASAQTYKPRDQTCANKSTARDDVKRSDQRCLHVTPDTYLEALGKYAEFLSKNPSDKITKGPKGVTVSDGFDKNGDPYRIVSGPGGIAGSGSASGLTFTPNSRGGSGGGKGRTSAR